MAAKEAKTAGPAASRQVKLRSSLLDSYQGRYLTFALTSMLALVAGAWFAYHYVSSITAEQVARMKARNQMQHQLQQSTGYLRRIDAWVQRQLIEPGIRQPTRLEARIEEFQSALPDPDSLPPGAEGRQLLERMRQEEIPTLKNLARRFLQLSHHNSERFPATVIMQTRMRGHAEHFLEILDQAIDELTDAVAPEQIALLSTLYRLRSSWQQIVSEFRLLVANRFGVFADDPMTGLKARAHNISAYYEHLQRLLDTLSARPIPDGSLFLDETTWQRLREMADQWHQGYQEVLAELTKDPWRRDLAFYQQTLEPRLVALQDDLNQLQGILGQEAEGGIRELSATAERMTRTILLLALLLGLLLVAAYFYLHSRIIRPVLETTRALRQEALGLSDASLEPPKLRETRELVNAFSEMKREVRRRQQGLDHLAHHDPLTQLPNRVLFKDRLEHAVNLARRNNQVVALLFLDLDNFKQINDTLGHLAGDELLVIVSRRLKNLLRHTDTVARLGGDEFAILLENVAGKRQTRNIASKILDALSEPVSIADQEFHITASIGIAMAPYDDSRPDDLIRDADAAMYEAKRRGKNAYSFFTSELLQRATSQLNLERELRGALERGEFLFHFQPIVHTHNRKIYGVEALIRWRDSSGRLRYPDEFMETLLNLDPHQQFMERLMLQVNGLQEKCLQKLSIPLRVSINMSASMLRSATRHKRVLDSLTHRAHPELLHIEITEDTLLEDLANARVLLTEIKRLGIPLVLDDFGTGQSSLNHLRSFPFDAIKVDREFVMKLERKPEDATLVKAIVQLAHSFNMKVVAEGVENQEQYDFLRGIGCDYVQGHLLGKPVSGSRLFAQLEYIRSQSQLVH